MSDADLEQIRQARLQQLQQQAGGRGGAGGDGEQQEQVHASTLTPAPSSSALMTAPPPRPRAPPRR